MTLVAVYLSADRPHERVRALHKLRDHFRRTKCGLIVMAGDFNFVMEAGDRWSTLSGAPGHPNSREVAAMKELCSEFGLEEWYQPECTNCTAGIWSRLDGAYANVHQADLQM